MVNWIISNHIGDIASIVGIFITIVGFIITIVNVIKSKNAVLNVRNDISKMDIITQLSSTIVAIDEIIRLQRESAWAVVQDRYGHVRRSILEIKMIDLPSVASVRSELQDSISRLREIEDFLIKSKLSKTVLEPKLPAIHTILSNTSDRLTELLQSIKNQIGR